MRLIDADAFIAKLNHVPMVQEAIRKAMDTMPTIEERKGKWIELTNTNHTYVCSVCGRMLVNITDGKNKVAEHYPYCHCGARMVQEGAEHETDRS